MADDDRDEGGGRDVMAFGPPVGDSGFHTYIRHRPDCSIETGLAKPLREGESMDFADGIVQVDAENNVTQLYERPRAVSDGPAQVATESYRSGWDRIFSTKQTVGQA